MIIHIQFENLWLSSKKFKDGLFWSSRRLRKRKRLAHSCDPPIDESFIECSDRDQFSQSPHTVDAEKTRTALSRINFPFSQSGEKLIAVQWMNRFWIWMNHVRVRDNPLCDNKLPPAEAAATRFADMDCCRHGRISNSFGKLWLGYRCHCLFWELMQIKPPEPHPIRYYCVAFIEDALTEYWFHLVGCSLEWARVGQLAGDYVGLIWWIFVVLWRTCRLLEMLFDRPTCRAFLAPSAS